MGGLWRTGVVGGITDSWALWGERGKRYRQIRTLPTRALAMAKAKCRSSDHATDAGAYCSSCAADIMAKALNPFFADGERSSSGWSCSGTSLPPLNTCSSSNQVRTIVR